MSAYSTTATKLRDGGLILEALKEMGYQPIDCIGKPRQLEDWHGQKRPDFADIIIPRAQIPGLSNDIGFRLTQDGTFSAIISEYDARRQDETWVKTLAQHYQEKGLMRQAKAQGLRFVGKQQIPGTTKYKLKFIEVGYRWPLSYARQS